MKGEVDMRLLSKSMRKQIMKQRDYVFQLMSKEGITQEQWNDLNERYQAYNNMLKPGWKVTPDTVLIVLCNLLGIILILKHEKIDIITSKALGFVMKGWRV